MKTFLIIISIQPLG